MKTLAQTPAHARAQAIRDGGADIGLDKNITKRAYEAGYNVSRYLETLDPSGEHKNGARTDAFNRVLKACGIRTRSVPSLGIRASTLEEVVKHPKARHLAVEIFARAYRAVAMRDKDSMSRAPINSLEGIAGSFINQYAYPAPRAYLLEPAISLNDVIGVTTGINQSYYRPFFLQEVANANSRVGEGAEIPAVQISTSEKTITLKKYGRRIDATYESARHIPIDLLGFYVQRVAIQVEVEKVDKVVDILVNGDGTSNTAATNYNLTALDPATVAGTLTLKAWLAFKMKFLNPRILTTVLGQDADVLKLFMLNAGSGNIPLVALGSLLSQQGVSPINPGLTGEGVRAGWLSSPPSGKLIGFDARLSVERVFEIGGQIQETDKDVKQQINSLVLSEVEGYATLDQRGVKTLNLSA